MEQLPRSKYSPCLQHFEFPLNEQIINEIGITYYRYVLIDISQLSGGDHELDC